MPDYVLTQTFSLLLKSWVSPLKALCHEYATDTWPGGNLPKLHPPVFLIKSKGLKTDCVKYRCAASAVGQG